ncbi:MAG: hypothetical protein ABWX68_09710 [Arthrobacter sp.]|uniref:hypothetical protein n=1 Tax=Arthrobacter sp. TaxID=1667 RepID=UPI003470B732
MQAHAILFPARLHDSGHPVHVVEGLAHNPRTVPDVARVVARHLAKNDRRGVLLAGHSKGGVIGK